MRGIFHPAGDAETTGVSEVRVGEVQARQTGAFRYPLRERVAPVDLTRLVKGHSKLAKPWNLGGTGALRHAVFVTDRCLRDSLPTEISSVRYRRMLARFVTNRSAVEVPMLA